MIRQKRVAIMLLLGALFVLGHGYFYFIEIRMFAQIRMICNTITTTLCLYGMLLLLLNMQGSRLRKVFAFVLGMMAFAGVATLIQSVTKGNPQPLRLGLFAPPILIYGNVYAYLCLLYPVWLFHVGKVNRWCYLVEFLPVLIPCTLYYVVVSGCDLSVTNLRSWPELLSHIGQFDVWFRFVIFVYPIWGLIRIMRCRAKYLQWHQAKSSDRGAADSPWVQFYLFGYCLLLCSYLLVVLGNNPQSLLMHGVCFILFFGFGLYGLLKQQFPAPVYGDVTVCGSQFCSDVRNDNANQTELGVDRYGFVDKIPEYKVILEQWMQDEKPYTNKDFKLLDVMQVLPLNRSYLSRMFNEVYGETFFSFVMRYRIEESVRLLTTRPDLTIASIAQACGFSSPSVFGRAFLQSKKMTPKQYRSNDGQ